MSEYWEGFEAALKMLNTDVDRILSVCYNDSRTRDPLLDVKGCIKALKELAPNDTDHLLPTL